MDIRDWIDFRTKYNTKRYPEQFKSRTEYLKYFKETYPLEYEKFRDHSNKIKKNYLPKAQTEAERQLYLKKQRDRYYKNKKWHQDYYKEYMKNPINKQKNNERAKEWYHKYKRNKSKAYHKEYMKNPINKQKNKDRSREYYYTKIRKVKDIPPVKERNYEIKTETFERKAAIKIDQLTNPITIDFSL